jgi:thymidylate synthase
MKKAVILFIATLTTTAFAQVDIDKKMNLLEKNVENAESNFNQFRDNLNISVKNFNEATRVVNELRKLKKQALRDTKRSETNALVYGQVIGKYNEFIASEQSNILKEEEAVTKLENLIQNIKKNTDERRGLISSYNVEIQKAEAEVGVWREKKREVASVIGDIGDREVGALDERKKWMGKKEV